MSWMYIREAGYARNPEHYTRAFTILQKDLIELFDYIEPSDNNLGCYSYRLHGIFMRVCIEVEANCRAILVENGYNRVKPDDFTMADYRRLEATHGLSHYRMRFPIWDGAKHERQPFSPWATDQSLPWYKAYNAAKHSRQEEFKKANLDNLLDAMAGLFVLISSQFYHEDFSNSPFTHIYTADEETGFISGIGGYFQIRFPDGWPEDERYDFDLDAWRAAGASFDRLF